MAFKYYNAGEAIRVSPKKSYREDFAAISDMAFDNASNVFLTDDEDFLEYEKIYGSKVFEKVDVRVDAVINPGTQINLGDDFKSFIFRQDFPAPFYGQMFRWQNSYWIVINTNNFESIPISCIARRCNNVLRWLDKDGNLYVEPCILAYDIWEGTNYSRDNITLAAGFVKAFCQKNMNTNKIVANMRFLFGNKDNRRCFKIQGNGIRNFLNQTTEDDDSPSYLEFTIGSDYVNYDTDNVIDGIADAYRSKYSLNIEQSYIAQNVGFTEQLIATVKKDNTNIYPELSWSSDNEEIATVDAEGNILLLKVGSAKITCCIKDNVNVSDSIIVEVVDNASMLSNFVGDKYEVIISPNVSEILEGNEQYYNCHLYKNGETLEDKFEFFVTGNIPDENYKFYVIDGNTFMVKNLKKYMNSKLKIKCVSGENIGLFEILLKGAW